MVSACLVFYLPPPPSSSFFPPISLPFLPSLHPFRQQILLSIPLCQALFWDLGDIAANKTCIYYSKGVQRTSRKLVNVRVTGRNSEWQGGVAKDNLTDDEMCELSPEGKRQPWEELRPIPMARWVPHDTSAPGVGIKLNCNDQSTTGCIWESRGSFQKHCTGWKEEFYVCWI